MKKTGCFLVVLMLGVFLSGCVSGGDGAKTSQPKSKPDEEAAVTQLVEEFGTRLQKVSLLGPAEVVSGEMDENYGDLVSPALLEQWKNDPLNAPGRLTSSPWPDRIESDSVSKISEDAYEVKGKIVEMTSSGVSGERPVTITVRRGGDGWRIDGVAMSQDTAADGGDASASQDGAVVYENADYGFRVSLPQSWEGYTVLSEQWEGDAPDGAKGEKATQTGPLLSIRHPAWTPQEPRQDIPVLVFTLSQWDSLQREEFHIGAAPILPKELGENESYVFALPARYNYGFFTGYEEVERLLEDGCFQAIEKK